MLALLLTTTTTLSSPLLAQLSAYLPFDLPLLHRLDPFFRGDFHWSNLAHYQWWRSLAMDTWEADPGHLTIELACLVVIVYLVYRKPYDPRDTERLTAAEQEELIKQWRPEPLASKLPANTELRHTPIVSDYNKQFVTVENKSYLNFVSHNFLGLAGHRDILDKCRETIAKYGVGSCGPRGFYGTFDIHLEIEACIAKYFNAPACILYSDGIATLSSVIPAFSKRGDLIVCDESVNFGIQQGIRLSRSNVLYYKHGDMEDLERILNDIEEKDLASGKRNKLNRRFIIVEGISSHYGDLTPLPQIIRLKQKYKYRLVLDDSLGIGVLGNTGRGSLEHWNLGFDSCELFCASMDTAIASVGGFCIGSNQVVDHQRLSGAGYCFSASSPPYTGTAAIEALRLMEANPSLRTSLREKCASLRKLLASSIPQLTLATKSAADNVSPIIHLHLNPTFSTGNRDNDELLLLRIKHSVYETDSIIVGVPEYISGERKMPTPSLLLAVTVHHEQKDLERAVKALKRATNEILSKK